MPTKITVGNWKMNGRQTDISELQLISTAAAELDCRTIICPPTTLLGNATKFSKKIFIGGQDCHPEPSGAYTGDISANMLADMGASHVIVGHSERRNYHGENSTIVKAKAEAAIAAGAVGPWEPGGISPFQLNLGITVAAERGEEYDSHGATVLAGASEGY